MKMIKDGVIIETTELVKNVWVRNGFVEYVEKEEPAEEKPKNKGGRPKAKP